MDYKNIIFDKEGDMAIIKFNRPKALNAINPDVIVETNDALDKFKGSWGWEAGVDGNVAFITVGDGERLDTTTIQDPIIGFVFDVKGLIADVSLKGAKFTKLDK